jgi:hypothetical protein
MAGLGWNPWMALRDRPRTTLMWQLLSCEGLVEVSPDGSAVVVLDPRLSRRERRAVLAHELIHLERRVLPNGSPRAVVEREEYQVRAETVRRLVPPLQLRQLVVTRSDVEPVTPHLVAEEFDVPVTVAVAALDRLRRDGWPSDGID